MMVVADFFRAALSISSIKGSRKTDNISTNYIKYSIEVKKMSGASESGVTELNKGTINNLSYSTYYYSITS